MVCILTSNVNMQVHGQAAALSEECLKYCMLLLLLLFYNMKGILSPTTRNLDLPEI